MPTPTPSESDTNSGGRRDDWSSSRSPDDDFLLRRDSASYLKQAVSTPCLTSIEGAEGAYIFGSDGTPYLDFHGNSAHQVGYGHPRLVSALKHQMSALPFVPRRYTSGVSVEFAEKLVEITPAGLDRVLMTTGGSDAIEVALKIARAATGRFKTLSFWESFHGAGFGAASVGGEQLFRSGPIGPLLTGTEHVPPIGCFRPMLGIGHRFDEPHTPECGKPLAELIDYVLRTQGDVAALVAEPMRAVPEMAAPGFWAAVRRSCDETGTLLVFDEIPTGLGRTGRMFAHEHEASRRCRRRAGHPRARQGTRRRDAARCGRDRARGPRRRSRLGVRPLHAREESDDGKGGPHDDRDHPAGGPGRALGRARGGRARSARGYSHSDSPAIGDVRGRGLMLGIELVEPDGSPNPDLAESVLYACLRRGLSFKTTMGTVLTLAPALTILESDLHRAFDILESALLEGGA